jgi:hypothetical protein
MGVPIARQQPANMFPLQRKHPTTTTEAQAAKEELLEEKMLKLGGGEAYDRSSD